MIHFLDESPTPTNAGQRPALDPGRFEAHRFNSEVKNVGSVPGFQFTPIRSLMMRIDCVVFSGTRVEM